MEEMMETLRSGEDPEFLKDRLQKLGHFLAAYEDLLITINDDKVD